MLETLLAIWEVIRGFVLILCAFIFIASIVGIFAGGNSWTRFVTIAFDFFWNVVTGGQIGITISSRAYIAKNKNKRWGNILVCGLNRLEKNHCQLSLQGDIDRAKSVIETLSPYDERNSKS